MALTVWFVTPFPLFVATTNGNTSDDTDELGNVTLTLALTSKGVFNATPLVQICIGD